VVLVGTLGDVAGSLISYAIADRLRYRLKDNREFKKAEDWYKRFGAASLFFGKLVPFIRAFIAFPAGIFRVKLWEFLLLISAGALVWITFLTYLGFVLGENWSEVAPYFRKFDYIIAAILIIGFVWWIKHRFGAKHGS